MAALRTGEFTASAAQIQHQSWKLIDACAGDQAEVDETRFFDPGDDLHFPSRR